MEQNTLELTERSEVFEFASLREMVNQTLQQNFSENSIANGLSTGFRDIDKVISGFTKGQLTTIAVKPGMGKTALMLSLTNNIAIKNNHSVAIFSPERSRQKITNRLIESETGMSLEKLTHGNMKPRQRDHMFSLVNNIAKANVFIDDSPSVSADEIAQKARHLKLNKGIELIIVDYLELINSITNDNESREEQLSKIVLQLKEVARELNIPLVLFSQIPGHYYGKVNQRPSLKNMPVFLSELSDVVMFLHRSDIYQKNGNPEEEKNLVEIIIGKFDNKKNESVVNLRFIESLAKFTDK